MLVDSGQKQRTHDGLDLGWYALHTQYHHEKMVSMSLASKGLTVFLPLYSARRQWKDRIKEISLPLFTCYVFIREGLERYLDVVTTAGVHGFVCRAGQPALIPPLEIERIRQVVDRSARIEPYPLIKCGDQVRVIAGPLQGIEGILVRKKNFCRLVLTVELLGKSAAVEVDASVVERINSHGRTHALAALKVSRPALVHAE